MPSFFPLTYNTIKTQAIWTKQRPSPWSATVSTFCFSKGLKKNYLGSQRLGQTSVLWRQRIDLRHNQGVVSISNTFRGLGAQSTSGTPLQREQRIIAFLLPSLRRKHQFWTLLWGMEAAWSLPGNTGQFTHQETHYAVSAELDPEQESALQSVWAEHTLPRPLGRVI